MSRTLADHVQAVSSAIDFLNHRTGGDVVLAGYSQGGMFAYQAAALRRSAGIDSLITFGSPVDSSAPLPVPLSPQAAARLAGTWPIRHVQPHQHPGLVLAARLPGADPGEVGPGPDQVLHHAARPGRAAAPRGSAPLPRAGRLDDVVRTGGGRVPGPVLRAQPDARGRLPGRRPAGHAGRHHRPGSHGRRRQRHPGPPRCSPCGAPGRPAGRRLRTHPAGRPLRPGRGFHRQHPHLAGRRQLGALAGRARRAARRHQAGPGGREAGCRRWGAGHLDPALRGRHRRRPDRDEGDPAGRLDGQGTGQRRPDATRAHLPTRTPDPHHPDLARPDVGRAGRGRTRGSALPLRRSRAPPRGRQAPHRQRRARPGRHRGTAGRAGRRAHGHPAQRVRPDRRAEPVGRHRGRPSARRGTGPRDAPRRRHPGDLGPRAHRCPQERRAGVLVPARRWRRAARPARRRRRHGADRSRRGGPAVLVPAQPAKGRGHRHGPVHRRRRVDPGHHHHEPPVGHVRPRHGQRGQPAGRATPSIRSRPSTTRPRC